MSYLSAEASQRPSNLSRANSPPPRDINFYRPRDVILATTGKRYIPSLYQNPDKDLARKIKTFLRKPPLNSKEHFERWSRSQSEPIIGSDFDDARNQPRVRTSPDEISKELLHLLPEKRKIQSTLLPPITSGCTKNFHSKYKAADSGPVIKEASDIMEQLKYCRYLRPKPKKPAWAESDQDWGSLYLH